MPARKIDFYLNKTLKYKQRGKLLDIGCAYGLFCKAASAIVAVSTDPAADTILTQGAEQVEPPLLTTVHEEATAPDTASQPNPLRAGSKGAALLALLQREEGASLDEMIERTGWQGHTARAAMTGLRKKGHVIDKRTSGNSTVWFIAAEPAA